MRSFQHVNARTIRQACDLLREFGGRAVLTAGGTDLLSTLKGENLPQYPEAVINIKTVPGLTYIRESRGGLKIGALAGLLDILESDAIRRRFPALADAALSVATPQIRAMATIGGNLCQDVRCWYYRYPAALGGPIACLRKGGSSCPAVRGDNRYHAVFEGKRCFAVCPSDMAVALSALDARLTIAGPEGERTMEVPDLYGNGRLSLNPDEMLTEVTLPDQPSTRRQRFVKFTLRKPVDFAVVSLACALDLSGDLCRGARLVLGAVSTAPYRARKAEEFLKGRRMDGKAIEQAVTLALSGARPLRMNSYKLDIAGSLIREALTV